MGLFSAAASVGQAGYSYARGLVQRFLPRFPISTTFPVRSEWEARRQLFAELWGAYENSRYDKQVDQGQREIIQERLRDLACENLDGVFAFPERVIKSFSDILSGPFGVRLDIEKNVPQKGVPVDDRLRNSIKTLWDWSNFDIQLPLACLTTAVTGNCGLRVQARAGSARSVVIRVEDPDWIRLYEDDADRNAGVPIARYAVTPAPWACVPATSGAS